MLSFEEIVIEVIWFFLTLQENLQICLQYFKEIAEKWYQSNIKLKNKLKFKEAFNNFDNL